jgi:hypothetical protein
MDPNVAHLAITDLVKRIRRHLETAASVAKAGAACAEAGSPGRAVDIVIELGDDLHEIDRLFAAALAITAEA